MEFWLGNGLSCLNAQRIIHAYPVRRQSGESSEVGLRARQRRRDERVSAKARSAGVLTANRIGMVKLTGSALFRSLG